MTIITKHFRSILDALPNGIFISDVAGTALYINRMYEQITGLKQERVQGKNVRTLLNDGTFDHILNPEIVATGKPSTHVQSLANGKKLALNGFPVFDSRGTLCLVVTIVRDITMITHLNDQLKEQRNLISQINEQMAYLAEEESRKTDIVFQSTAMKSVQRFLVNVARSNATLLIMGETGVGKDVFARYTHSMSTRNDKILLKVDCGSIAENLIESEMFGYMPGSFTGAGAKGKAGYFELAQGGTVFLDEIGELPLQMQTRLLRVLQDGEIMRIGGSSPRQVDVRIIAATNRDLEKRVQDGLFRSDLYYRLKVASVSIPPLRDRPDDIQPLAEHFLTKYCTKYHKAMAFMDIAMEYMLRYAWPGNIRELQNMIHSLVITNDGPLISLHDLPSQVAGQPSNGAPCIPYDDVLQGGRPLKLIVADMECDFLKQAIELHGSVQKVAELFHINRSTIFRKLQRMENSSRPEE
ncbi:MAG: sigma 54-interacting transcriptional regulator [bacterium]|nr:sigma 54-interacting transcriptional regulator [bacterium]